jgi:hypothetical protein
MNGCFVESRIVTDALGKLNALCSLALRSSFPWLSTAKLVKRGFQQQSWSSSACFCSKDKQELPLACGERVTFLCLHKEK